MTQKASMKRLLDNSANNATGSGNSRFIQMLQSEGSTREETLSIIPKLMITNLVRDSFLLPTCSCIKKRALLQLSPFDQCSPTQSLANMPSAHGNSV